MMLSARRLARTLTQSKGLEGDKIIALIRRLMREPKAQVGRR